MRLSGWRWASTKAYPKMPLTSELPQRRREHHTERSVTNFFQETPTPPLWSTALHRRHSSHPSHSRPPGTSIHQQWNDRHHGLIHADKNA